MNTPKNIVETALAAGNFSTFSNAIAAAGLTETLKGPGPYTLFAPTDDAFAKLPPETVEALMKDKKKLSALVNYHTLRGSLHSWDLPHGKAKTIEGNSIRIGATDEGMTVDQANVSKKDIRTSNGVIHAIDAVIMPGAHSGVPKADGMETAWAGKRRDPTVKRRP